MDLKQRHKANKSSPPSQRSGVTDRSSQRLEEPKPPYNTSPAAHATDPLNSVSGGVSHGKLKTAIRNVLLPCILWETHVIAALQAKIRCRPVDAFFKYLGALGTHTAFLLGLPCLFWFESGNTLEIHGQSVDVNRVYGRSLVVLLAAGVYVSGAMKDWLGLPRPLAPPVIRLSTSASIDVEYGFPSTHTANAVSLSLYTALHFHRYIADGWSESGQTFVYYALATYAALIALSRLLTGMHTVVDIVGGAIIGVGLVLVHWWWIVEPMEEWLMTSWTVPLAVVPLCVILISIHPDPEGPCPCFDDSVAFVGTLGGLLIGNWHWSMYNPVPPPTPNSHVVLLVLERLTCGIGLIVVWRVVTKRICYKILPPLYRLLALPFGRKFFSLADKDYNSIPSEHVSFAPSLLHLSQTEAMRFRLPRYDVDIASKLIVYCGIGWIAVEVAPVVFTLLHI
ncbi:phosphatidic acid phosphatase type 2/haloperoxidase [Fimicolochytrium jonesii]|uniref:phosphatidic acid phosphatase type 2/haloperoxidase n=1 Tax=Fimicolochytrium jonesii TaxID=1396493 RepID=UPI0022FE29A6|nr:phosphatidic acid phosphatase type 2/haloperoxidase [Fimicolochytrium jonesii]KAI8822088.1 phosphatidic acid phosphatase type 2/haloperoxidase [Fimicolochytrium jonesii]